MDDLPSDIGYKDQGLTPSQLQSGQRAQDHGELTSSMAVVATPLVHVQQVDATPVFNSAPSGTGPPSKPDYMSGYPPAEPAGGGSSQSNNRFWIKVAVIASLLFGAVGLGVGLGVGLTTSGSSDKEPSTMVHVDQTSAPVTTNNIRATRTPTLAPVGGSTITSPTAAAPAPISSYPFTIPGSDAIHLSNRPDVSIPDVESEWPDNIFVRDALLAIRGQKETLPSYFDVSSCSQAVVSLEAPAAGFLNLCYIPSDNTLDITCDYEQVGPSGTDVTAGQDSPQTVGSFGGISGYTGLVGALVGVFLDDDIPTRNPPNALNFGASGIEFPTLSPKLGQVFYIGDGFTSDGTAQSFVAPTGATRVYLGIIDGEENGRPGFYTNNQGFYSGRLQVRCS